MRIEDVRVGMDLRVPEEHSRDACFAPFTGRVVRVEGDIVDLFRSHDDICRVKVRNLVHATAAESADLERAFIDSGKDYPESELAGVLRALADDADAVETVEPRVGEPGMSWVWSRSGSLHGVVCDVRAWGLTQSTQIMLCHESLQWTSVYECGGSSVSRDGDIVHNFPPGPRPDIDRLLSVMREGIKKADQRKAAKDEPANAPTVPIVKDPRAKHFSRDGKEWRYVGPSSLDAYPHHLRATCFGGVGAFCSDGRYWEGRADEFDIIRVEYPDPVTLTDPGIYRFDGTKAERIDVLEGAASCSP